VLELPDTAILAILEYLDGKSLSSLSKTCTYFQRYFRGEKLTEHVAKQRVLGLHGGCLETASRFRCVLCLFVAFCGLLLSLLSLCACLNK
jgi:hypothetical protein